MSRDSMYNYSQFAWGDALSLAEWLVTEFDLIAIRKEFDAMSQSSREKFDHEFGPLIEELLRRTEGQRPAFLLKVGKDASETMKGLLLVFGIMGLVSVRTLIEIRDWLVLMGPGGSYRQTNARIYDVRKHVEPLMHRLFTHEWPSQVFVEYKSECGLLDEDEEDDDDSSTE